MEFSVSDWVDVDGGAVKCFFFFHIVPLYQKKKKKVNSFTSEISNKNLDLKVDSFHLLAGKLLNS